MSRNTALLTTLLIAQIGCFGQFSIQHFTTDDGLESNFIGDFVQTSDGYVWFINADQLCRFDGGKFEYFYDISKPNGIGNYFQQRGFIPKVEGGLVVPMGKDLYLFTGSRFIAYPKTDSSLFHKQLFMNRGTGAYVDDVDKYGQHAHFGLESWVHGMNGTKKIDSLTLPSNIQLRIYLGTQEYSKVEDDILYVLKKGGKVEKTKLNYSVDGFQVVNRINDLVVFSDKSWNSGDSTQFIISNAEGILWKGEIPTPNLISQRAQAMPKLIKTNKGFSFYFGGTLVTQDQVYFDKELLDIPNYILLSDSKVLFYDKNAGLILKDFIQNETFYLGLIKLGLEEELHFHELIDGSIFVSSSQGFYLLNSEQQFYKNSINTKIDYLLPSYTLASYGGTDSIGVRHLLGYHDTSYTNMQVDPYGFGFIQVGSAISFLPDGPKIYPEYTVVRKTWTGEVYFKNNKEIAFPLGDSLLIIPNPNGTNRDFEPIYIYKNRVYAREYWNNKWSFYSCNLNEKAAFTKDSNLFKGFGFSLIGDKIIGRTKNPPNEIFYFHSMSSGIIDSLVFKTSDFKNNWNHNAWFKNNFLWLATENGDLISIDINTRDTSRFHNVLNDLVVGSIGAIDYKDHLWIASDKGIAIVDLKQGRIVDNIVSPLIYPSEIGELFATDNNELVIVNNKAVFWLDIEKFHNEGKIAIEELFNDRQYPGYYQYIETIENGDISIGSGIHLVNNFSAKNTEYKPHIRLKSIKVDSVYIFGESPSFNELNIDQIRQLYSFEENNLSFEFTALEFRNHDKLQYRYKCTNIAEDWKYIQTPIFELSNLSPSNYTLEVQSVYNQIPSESFIYKFKISPPWYKTWWAYLTYILLVLGVIYAIFKARTAQLRKRQTELELEVENAIKEIRHQKEAVENQKEIIEEAHKEITDSINYAERIQRSFLATEELLKNNLGEHFIYFNPKEAVSGDFYWAGKLENGNFAVSCADSTGHGVPGAIMSILNISSIEKAVENKATKPAEIFNQARKLIIERLKKDGSPEGGKDGMDASLISFNPEKTLMQYVAAHNPIWVIRAGELIDIRAEKMPVGKHDHDHIPFEGGEFELQKGDIIYTLTDGYQDQFGGEKGKKYKVKPFKRLLLDICELPMPEQHQKISETFDEWKMDLEQVDDVCVIGVRI